MTITEIVEREVAKAREAFCDCPRNPNPLSHGGHYASCEVFSETSSDGIAHAACLAVAKAVVEECAKIAHDQVEFAIKMVGEVSSGWLSASEDIEESIRALAAQGPGGATE